MKILSPSIARAVEIAEAAGNSIQEISEGWTKIRQVVHMRAPLSLEVQQRIESELPDLRYRELPRTPQNPAIKDFICDEDKVALSFPWV